MDINSIKRHTRIFRVVSDIYGISCDKDSIIIRDAANGNSTLSHHPYNTHISGLRIPDKHKDEFYNQGRFLYKNEIVLFNKNNDIEFT